MADNETTNNNSENLPSEEKKFNLKGTVKNENESPTQEDLNIISQNIRRTETQSQQTQNQKVEQKNIEQKPVEQKNEKTGQPKQNYRQHPKQPFQQKNFENKPKKPFQRREFPKQQNNYGQKNIDNTFVSIVIPLYNEEESLRELHSKIKDAMTQFPNYEIIFVDDGSSDNSSHVLRSIRHNDKRVKFIRFRRNYGKSAALDVGFKHAKGDIIITMDADLQDDPNEIPKLIAKLKSGFDVVSGWKKKRYDPISKTLPSKFFNFITSIISGVKLHDFNCGLKAYKSDVAKQLEIYAELHRYIPVLAYWNGAKVSEEIVAHRPRKFGKSKFGASRFWRGFFDLLTVMFVVRYYKRPLHFFGGLGAMSFFVGFLINLKLTIDWFYGETLSNRPLLFVGILLIIVGFQFFSTGLLGDIIIKKSSSETDYSISEKHL